MIMKRGTDRMFSSGGADGAGNIGLDFTQIKKE
jgi:hypothetical protein